MQTIVTDLAVRGGRAEVQFSNDDLVAGPLAGLLFGDFSAQLLFLQHGIRNPIVQVVIVNENGIVQTPPAGAVRMLSDIVAMVDMQSFTVPASPTYWNAIVIG